MRQIPRTGGGESRSAPEMSDGNRPGRSREWNELERRGADRADADNLATGRLIALLRRLIQVAVRQDEGRHDAFKGGHGGAAWTCRQTRRRRCRSAPACGHASSTFVGSSRANKSKETPPFA